MDRLGMKNRDVARERRKKKTRMDAEAEKAPMAVMTLYWRVDMRLGIWRSFIRTGH